MTAPRTSPAWLLVPSVLLIFRWTGVSAQTPELAGALPYDAAFDTREFLSFTALAVSPDGNEVAYEARQQPADTNLSDRSQPNGISSLIVGSKIYISDRSGQHTTAGLRGELGAFARAESPVDSQTSEMHNMSAVYGRLVVAGFTWGAR